MAAFKQDFSISQSNDCITVTLADTSNFGDNDEGYVYSTFTTKQITVYDSNNTIIGTPITIVDDTPVTFTLDKDRYIQLVYTLSNDTLDLNLTKKLILTCYVELKFGQQFASGDCGCTSDDDTECKTLKALKAADIFGRRGNGVKSQDAIDLANIYINCN